MLTQDIKRPSRELIEAFAGIGSATASGDLNRLGIRNSFIQGPVSRIPGTEVVGPALTLQFMPLREDQYYADEYSDPEEQLHRHVLYHAQPGDIVVVDARGSLSSGCFGDMMLTYFKGKGGIGVVVDGCIKLYVLMGSKRHIKLNYHIDARQQKFVYILLDGAL